LGIPASPASDAVNEFWEEWDKKGPAEGRLFVVLVTRDAKWTVLLCWQKLSGGPLRKIGRSSEMLEFPTRAFAVLPVSDVFDQVTVKLTQLLNDTKKS